MHVLPDFGFSVLKNNKWPIKKRVEIKKCYLTGVFPDHPGQLLILFQVDDDEGHERYLGSGIIKSKDKPFEFAKKFCPNLPQPGLISLKGLLDKSNFYRSSTIDETIYPLEVSSINAIDLS